MQFHPQMRVYLEESPILFTGACFLVIAHRAAASHQVANWENWCGSVVRELNKDTGIAMKLTRDGGESDPK